MLFAADISAEGWVLIIGAIAAGIALVLVQMTSLIIQVMTLRRAKVVAVKVEEVAMVQEEFIKNSDEKMDSLHKQFNGLNELLMEKVKQEGVDQGKAEQKAEQNKGGEL